MTAVTKCPDERDIAQEHKFALWSAAYDAAPNPLLTLEERVVASLLPSISGKDVVDVGCGTGRWLSYWCSGNPGTLTGIDFSPEMLDRAQRKLGGRAKLVLGNATSLPLPSRSADLVLSSFVISYVSDLAAMAAELRRITRPNGLVSVSDMHPGTALSCNWKRHFRSADEHVEMRTSSLSIEEVVSTFQTAGLELITLVEPPFEAPELEIFARAGKTSAFDAATGLPAIYIAAFRITEASTRLGSRTRLCPERSPGVAITGARVALDADIAVTGDLMVRDGRISSLTSRTVKGEAPNASQTLDVSEHLLLPGLINAHDHLEFGLYPNLGRGPYTNAAEWAGDIQQSEQATIAAHQAVPKAVRVWWGAIRNLLCGATTICHHNPLQPEMLDPEFPVRVVSEFGWAHSRAVDTALKEKFESTPAERPFVLHACEGIDEPSTNEIFELDRLGVLTDRTILVHGVALHREGIELLNKRGAALVLCPSSNHFLFGRTLDRESVRSIRRHLLGTDSPLTAAGDLLDEIRTAQEHFGLSAAELYRMLSRSAASVLCLSDGQGQIRPGGVADFIAVRDRQLSPAETLAHLTVEHIELVVVRGRVQLASDTLFRKLPEQHTVGLRPLIVDSVLRWVRAPLGQLFHEAERALGSHLQVGGKRVRHACATWI